MKRLLILYICCLLLAGCAASSPDSTDVIQTAPSVIDPTRQEETIATEPSISDDTTPTQPSETTPEETVEPTEPPPATQVPTEPPQMTVPTESIPNPTTPTQPEPAPTEPTKPKPKPTEPTKPADPITAYIESMTLAERVGQLFLARCPASNAISDIEKYHLGGFVLFARDFENETVSSVTKTIKDYQSAADIPMLLAVDEEGGKVNRVSKYPTFRATPFLSPREIYAAGGLDAIKQNEKEKSQLLSSLGINVNLSPVCDITTNPEAFMYSRSLGEDPETTGKFVQSMLNVQSKYGIGGVLKHFPGYGDNTDTHVAIAIDNRSLSELESCDLVPFQMGIDNGCGAIMVSHTFINALDDTLPATLSPTVNQYLRENMGFDGVVVTDDLVMQAIADLYGAGESAVMAVQAGNDLLCSTEYQTQYSAVLSAVKEGRISQQRINEAVRRILTWKIEIGLLDI